MNWINYFLWILIICGFYGNRPTTGLALYLKMLELVTTISGPNFMLVSKSRRAMVLDFLTVPRGTRPNDDDSGLRKGARLSKIEERT